MATAARDMYVEFSFKGKGAAHFPVTPQKSIKWKVKYIEDSLHVCLTSGALSADVQCFAVNGRRTRIGTIEGHSVSKALVIKRGEYMDVGLNFNRALPEDKTSNQRITPYTVQQSVETTLKLMITRATPIVLNPAGSSLPIVLKKSLSQDGSEDLNDILLYFGADKKLVQVSKFMLMARSPVFAAMFRSDCEESRSNKVEIPDISPEVGEELISYMYTDNTPNIGTMTEELWYAANKYDLPGLKALCENELAEQTNTGNAAHMLLFAHKFCGSGVLKEYILSYITKDKKTCSQVKQSEEWSEVVKYTELLRSIMDKYFDDELTEPPAKKSYQSLTLDPW